MEMATSLANTHEQHFKRSDELYMRLLAVETYLKQFPNGPNAPPESHVPQGHDISGQLSPQLLLQACATHPGTRNSMRLTNHASPAHKHLPCFLPMPSCLYNTNNTAAQPQPQQAAAR